VKRGDVVVCTLSGENDKPRPAVIVQSDLFNPTHASVVVCPVTSHLVHASLFRLDVPLSGDTGLLKDSQIMVDKMTSIRANRIQQQIGYLSIKQRTDMDKALKIWLGL